jgi:hypothetical protein
MRRGCSYCGWNGNPHLCGCMAKIGHALHGDDILEARRLFEVLMAQANASEQRRRDGTCDLKLGVA